jgi:hypothetical protein
LLAFRFHFFALVGALTTLLLWPNRSKWKAEVNYKTSVLLLSLLGVLFLAHAWASLGVNTQTYDALATTVSLFPVYLSFFSFSSCWWLPAPVPGNGCRWLGGYGYSGPGAGSRIGFSAFDRG